MVWTPEAILSAIWEWSEIHGEPPAMADWNPRNARHAYHDEERARRFEDEQPRWPWFTIVVRAFGSWNAAIEAAGFAGRAAHGGDGNGARHRSMRAKAAA